MQIQKTIPRHHGQFARRERSAETRAAIIHLGEEGGALALASTITTYIITLFTLCVSETSVGCFAPLSAAGIWHPGTRDHDHGAEVEKTQWRAESDHPKCSPSG